MHRTVYCIGKALSKVGNSSSGGKRLSASLEPFQKVGPTFGNRQSLQPTVIHSAAMQHLLSSMVSHM